MLITKLKIAARVVLLVLIGLAAGAGGWANWAAEASGQASEPVPTRGKLDEEKTASVPFGTETIDLLPVGPMPVPFLVRLKPDGKLRVQRPVPVYMPVTETYEDGRTGTGYRLITHVLREDVDPERDRIEVYNVQGKRLDPNALSGLLKGDTVALLFPDGRSADPRLFKLFREGTLFFVLPTLSSPPAVPTRPVIEVIEEEVPPVVVPPAAAAPSKHETAPRPRTMRLRSGDYQRLQTKTRRNIADVAVLKPTIIRVDPVPNDPTSIMVTGLLAGATDLILGGVDNTRETVVVLVEDASAQIRPRLYRGKPMSYWIEQLSDGDPSYRKEAVTVLGVISQDDRSAIELLLGALRDKDATVRNEAVYYLGYAGAPAVPPLIGLLKEEGPLRALAALALAYHGRDAKPAMTALIDVLKSHDPEARRAAARALGGIGPKAKEAIPAIIQAFKQGRIMQQDVFTALVQIEPEIYKIIPRRFFDGDTSCEEKKKAWQEAIEELEKRYPPRASKPVR